MVHVKMVELLETTLKLALCTVLCSAPPIAVPVMFALIVPKLPVLSKLLLPPCPSLMDSVPVTVNVPTNVELTVRSKLKVFGVELAVPEPLIE